MRWKIRISFNQISVVQLTLRLSAQLIFHVPDLLALSCDMEIFKPNPHHSVSLRMCFYGLHVRLIDYRYLMVC